MSELTDKASGIANQAAGKVKQGVGNATGSDRLQAEGAAQEARELDGLFLRDRPSEAGVVRA